MPQVREHGHRARLSALAAVGLTRVNASGHAPRQRYFSTARRRPERTTVMVAKRHVVPTLLGTLLIAAALPAPGEPARAQTAQSIQRGKEIAERACSGCHAIDSQKGATVQGTDVPSFRTIAGRPNQTAGRLETLVMVPHRPMPAIPLELSEVRDVVAYILSLK
jgi:mono/diheme cytochrome c family protein